MEFKNWLEDEQIARLNHNPKYERNKQRLGNLPPYLYFASQDPESVSNHGLGGPGFTQRYQGTPNDNGIDLSVNPKGKGQIFKIPVERLDLDELDFLGNGQYHYNQDISPDIIQF
jgi:hypothetical protein